ELNKVGLFFFENLHAKCYYNEIKMVITSMNMYEFSEKNNREMGVLIDRTIDKDLFEKAVKETSSIFQSAEQIPLSRTERKIATNVNKGAGANKVRARGAVQGYCIRCEARIDFNPNKPYCGDCYLVWAQFENPDYQE